MTATTTTAWAHLPNAKHIDAIAAHFKNHRERWADARDAARVSAWDASWVQLWYAAWGAARAAARGSAPEDARESTRDCAYDAALGAYYALAVWYDAGPLMDVHLDTVRTLAAAGHRPAILLLPARLAMEEA